MMKKREVDLHFSMIMVYLFESKLFSPLTTSDQLIAFCPYSESQKNEFKGRVNSLTRLNKLVFSKPIGDSKTELTKLICVIEESKADLEKMMDYVIDFTPTRYFRQVHKQQAKDYYARLLFMWTETLWKKVLLTQDGHKRVLSIVAFFQRLAKKLYPTQCDTTQFIRFNVNCQIIRRYVVEVLAIRTGKAGTFFVRYLPDITQDFLVTLSSIEKMNQHKMPLLKGEKTFKQLLDKLNSFYAVFKNEKGAEEIFSALYGDLQRCVTDYTAIFESWVRSPKQPFLFLIALSEMIVLGYMCLAKMGEGTSKCQLFPGIDTIKTTLSVWAKVTLLYQSEQMRERSIISLLNKRQPKTKRSEKTTKNETQQDSSLEDFEDAQVTNREMDEMWHFAVKKNASSGSGLRLTDTRKKSLAFPLVVGVKKPTRRWQKTYDSD